MPQSIGDLSFFRPCCWIFNAPGMWRCVIQHAVPNILKALQSFKML